MYFPSEDLTCYGIILWLFATIHIFNISLYIISDFNYPQILSLTSLLKTWDCISPIPFSIEIVPLSDYYSLPANQFYIHLTSTLWVIKMLHFNLHYSVAAIFAKDDLKHLFYNKVIKDQSYYLSISKYADFFA